MILAHEGEEFVMILPVVMLGAALFLMRWGTKSDTSEEQDTASPPGLDEAHRRPDGPTGSVAR
jgi:hypothetical protein